MKIFTNIIKLVVIKGKYSVLYKNMPLLDNISYAKLTSAVNEKNKKKSDPYKILEGKLSLMNRRFDPHVAREAIKFYMRKEILKNGLVKHVFEPNKSIETWDQLRELVGETLLNRENEFKVVLSAIMSLWFQKNTSVYLMLIGHPGSGKTTLLDCFNRSKEVLHIDETTMQSFAPGTADVNQSTSSLLEECNDRTLMIQDLSGMLGGHESIIKKFVRFLTTAYGRQQYKKHSPGGGLKTYDARFNFVFGITPDVLYDKSNSKFGFNAAREFKRSQKFIYLNFVSDDDVNERVVIENLEDINVFEIQRAVAGFLENKKKLAKNFKVSFPLLVREGWLMRFRLYSERKKTYKDRFSKTPTYHENRPDLDPKRYWHQFKAIISASCLIEGRAAANSEDVKFYFELL